MARCSRFLGRSLDQDLVYYPVDYVGTDRTGEIVYAKW